MPLGQRPTGNERIQQEIDVLEQFALRWAVLAAWQDELIKHKSAVPANLNPKLEVARTKLASGCFSSCEVGCDLSEIEGILVSIAASQPAGNVDFWIELLGHAMSEKRDNQRLLAVPSVRFRYSGCGIGCGCHS